MNLRKSLYTIACLGLCSMAWADLSFMLMASYEVNGVKGAGTSTTYSKGSRLRYDDTPTDTTIIDTKEKKVIILNRDKKTYITGDWKPLPKKALPIPVTITPTERRTTIAGQPARLYLMKAQAKEAEVEISGEVWCAENIAHIETPRTGGGGYVYEEMYQSAKGQMLRFRARTTVKGKLKASISWDVSAISNKELPDSYFEIPAGYSEDTTSGKKDATKLESDK